MSQQASERLAGVVRIVGADGEFLGTGIAVTRDLVVTCAHVVAGERVVRLDAHASGGARDALPEARVLALDAHDPDAHDPARDDVTVLRAHADMTLAPLPVLRGLTPALLTRHARRLRTYGFASAQGAGSGASKLSLRGAVWTRGDGCVQNGQIDGGVPHGLSGAPLLVRDRDAWAVAGMFYLGGEAAGHSVFYGADVLLAALAAHERAPDDVRAAETDGSHAELLLALMKRKRARLGALLLAGALGALVLGAMMSLRLAPWRHPRREADRPAQSAHARSPLDLTAATPPPPSSHESVVAAPSRAHADVASPEQHADAGAARRLRARVRPRARADAATPLPAPRLDYDPLADPRRR